MLIDVGVSLFLLIMLWRGYATGAFSQVIRTLSIVAGYVIARVGAGGLAPAMDKAFKTEAPLGEIIAAVLLWLMSSYFISLGLRWLFKPAVERHLRGSNKVAGSIIGLGKGAILAYLVLGLVAVLATPISRYASASIVPVRTSYLVRLVAAHNILASWAVPALGRLEDLAHLARHPRTSLSADTRGLLSDPRIGILVQDPTLGNALVQGDWNYVLQDPRVRRIFDDPKLLKKLMDASIEMQQLGGEASR